MHVIYLLTWDLKPRIIQNKCSVCIPVPRESAANQDGWGLVGLKHKKWKQIGKEGRSRTSLETDRTGKLKPRPVCVLSLRNVCNAMHDQENSAEQHKKCDKGKNNLPSIDF